MSGIITKIQPAHATQVSVEKIFHTRPTQPETEQRYIQDQMRKLSEEKMEKAQEMERTDKAIIRERSRDERKKKEKQHLASAARKALKEARQGDSEDGERHLDIKI